MTDSGPTHYDVLGVAPTAGADELRSAYLALARRHHPDRHSPGPQAAAAEERMRALNAAWAVLGDPKRRAAYDLALARREAEGSAGPAGAGISRPSTSFRPYEYPDDEADDDAEGDADDWRFQPDEVDPDTAIGRVLGAGPPLLLFAGLGMVAVSFIVGLRAVAAAGIALLLLAGVLFIGAPLVALSRSQAGERRSSGRR